MSFFTSLMLLLGKLEGPKVSKVADQKAQEILEYASKWELHQAYGEDSLLVAFNSQGEVISSFIASDFAPIWTVGCFFNKDHRINLRLSWKTQKALLKKRKECKVEQQKMEERREEFHLKACECYVKTLGVNHD